MLEMVLRKGTLLHCCWKGKLVQPLWKTVWRFIRKVKTKLPYDSVIPLLGIYLDKVKWSEVKLLSRVRLFATPWTAAYQAPPSMGFSRQECWSGLPFPSPGDLPDPGIEPGSPALQADALLSEAPGKPYLDKTVLQKDTCSPMFIEALFTTAKTWKQLECLSTDEWIR